MNHLLRKETTKEKHMFSSFIPHICKQKHAIVEKEMSKNHLTEKKERKKKKLA
jgi:hypothetical protein